MFDWSIDLIGESGFFAPFLSFFLLILGGANLPISEDIVVISSALFSVTHQISPIIMYPAVFFGAYLGDFICYFLGRNFKNQAHHIPLINTIFKHPHRIERIESIFHHRNNFLVLIIGRFIPFGVRNVLFFVAGLTHMRILHFAVADLIASFLSTSIIFYLSYTYGIRVFEWVHEAHLSIFIVFVLILLLAYILYRLLSKRSHEHKL